ncbi:MAG: hypothetical protein H6569_01600 [Lewinellaceae bacterium]|nr:hypothetical protein [Lewinellaceae bacterium]
MLFYYNIKNRQQATGCIGGIRISALQLDTIQSLQNGVAPVRKGATWGALDASGKLIIPLEYVLLCER